MLKNHQDPLQNDLGKPRIAHDFDPQTCKEQSWKVTLLEWLCIPMVSSFHNHNSVRTSSLRVFWDLCPKEALCLCISGHWGEQRWAGALWQGKGKSGKRENEEGHSAQTAAKLFETIFSTGLIVLPRGAETPTPFEIFVSLLRGAAY